MTQVYTKEQIDNIAGIIGTEIRSTRNSIPEAATEFTSFVTALDNGYTGALVTEAGPQYMTLDIPTQQQL